MHFKCMTLFVMHLCVVLISYKNTIIYFHDLFLNVSFHFLSRTPCSTPAVPLGVRVPHLRTTAPEHLQAELSLPASLTNERRAVDFITSCSRTFLCQWLEGSISVQALSRWFSLAVCVCVCVCVCVWQKKEAM